jgi:putative acetyltransferase
MCDIRESREGDRTAIEQLYPAAFPTEDLIPLVRRLLADPGITLSLVATGDEQVIGHAILTRCALSDSSRRAALLGPVAVAPAAQRQGVGSALIEAGLRRLKDAGVGVVCVLGDPGYYGRFGFNPGCRISPPYDLPADWHDAWQCLALDHHGLPANAALLIPPPWDDAALWGP